ncbi:phage tail protein [Marinomonas ostreistagni]|uniref:Tail fiber protein n=1 Tax=Marinomonas ostreistagni TaxID=359209 RepID=A0ABS0ZCX9_9GAMM|nr:tail fiber protein [Marinomonas ostreistagni]MBJ7551510.1 tail fiber protein [Marinomonas ostreistagni]
MDGYYYGTTLQFAGNFPPHRWAFCNGNLLAIAQNQALFAILGTLWGGNGRTDFALPELQGRTPVGYGTGPGLPPNMIGQRFGSDIHTLILNEMPSHTHTAIFTPMGGGSSSSISAMATVNAGIGSDASDPTGKYWGVTKNGLAALNGYSSSAGVTMATDAINISISGGGGITGGTVTVGNTGASQAFELYQPSTVIPFIVCVDGLFPSRN